MKFWILAVQKIRTIYLIFRQFIFLRWKRRRINTDSKKIAFIGHSYHKKTQSSAFFIDHLKEHYDVDVSFDESWCRDGAQFPDLSFIDNRYLCVIFFQVVPKPEILGRITHGNIIFVPMYDQCGRWGYSDWLRFADLKIICFSKTLHRKLILAGLQSLYIQYFPKPRDFSPGSRQLAFFWQRITKLNINVIKTLFEGQAAAIHIHKAVDPGHVFVKPERDDEKNFKITYSDWFETRDEMWEEVKKRGLYIAPREYEGIGMSFLEAMAMGKAVIGVNNPTMNEYIKDKATGYLFDLSNPGPIDLSDMETVQENAHEFISQGYIRWQNDKHRIIEFIEKR